ncbi:MAG: CoA transferase [Vulcanimicrobiaceae bacterium]
MNAPVLDGVRVVSLATNIPGPLAAARCVEYGADVVKVEPQRGDALDPAAPQWYAQLVQGQRVLRLDFKEEQARLELDGLLAQADVLISAMRAGALQRLRLDWPSLHERFPRLCHVAVFGERPPHDDRAGHDLTYQARAGLVTPPAMPRTLVADLAAAERAFSAVLAALFHRERTGSGVRTDVGIVDAAQAFAAPLRHRLTTPDGSLGGALDVYQLYRASDGWIALAALEAHFIDRLPALLGTDDLRGASLRAVFVTKAAHEWEALGQQHDIPLAKVRGA